MASTSDTKKELRLPITQVIDNIVFTRNEVYAVYQVPTHSYEFMSTGAQIELANRLSTPFYSLMSNTMRPIPFQIFGYNFPVDLLKWEQQVYEATKDWDRGPSFIDYVDRQYDLLATREYVERTIYIAIGLSRRGELDWGEMNVLEVGLDNAKKSFLKFLKTALSIPSDDVSADEEKAARAKEVDVYNALSSGELAASRATAEEILLITKRMFYPFMPAPYLTGNYGERLGSGDLLIEQEGLVSNGARYLKFNQIINGIELETYRTCLTFAQFPKTTVFPSGAPPFLYLPNKMSLPFTTWASGFLLPSEKMKKELHKKQLEAKDELENLAGSQTAIESAVSPNVEASENVYDLQEMARILADDKSPWVSASYHVVVEANSLDNLKQYVEALRQEYQNQDIKLIQTPGDQKQLFVEQCFGAPKKITDFDQLMSLPVLSTSGVFFADTVGDKIKGVLD